MLLDRNYKKRIIDDNIKRAKAIPRAEALKRVVRSKSSDTPVFVAMFERRLPSILGL